MKSLVKMSILALAFGLFATACNNSGNQNADDQDSIPAIEQGAPAVNPEQVTPPADSADVDTTSQDNDNM